MENLLIYKYSKGDIKEAIKNKVKEEFKQEMEDSKKVYDRLSENPEDNSYMSKMPLHVNNMGCRFCSSGSDETQDHLELCAGTRHERRGLDMGEESGLLDFWRRMKFKLAAVT